MENLKHSRVSREGMVFFFFLESIIVTVRLEVKNPM